ncbi:eukaryotic initiation factor- epsilon [Cystoisospora suis]|uniref:Translation initiation factor eIF2B subunit epsilon n=1 Tax=Cystoisospora suis TaxID=483139 RepID=A0A2C6KX23_9APIC|nr:eukaryotic initiation factor- epsilon [Cystoisospora suis]
MASPSVTGTSPSEGGEKISSSSPQVQQKKTDTSSSSSSTTKTNTAGNKSNQGQGGRKGGGTDEDTVFETLPAVLVAFTLPQQKEYFAPLSYDFPLPLLPVSGVPLILSAFDFLARNGATDIYVLVKGDSEGRSVRKVVEEHEETFQKRLRRVVKKNLSVIFIEITEKADSMGEALREFANKNELRHDFLLMHTSTFIRADIREAIASHKLRSSTSSSRGVYGGEPVMTQLLTRASSSSRRRLLEDDFAFLIHSKSQELVGISSFRKQSQVEIGEDLATIGGGAPTRFEVRYDLIDAGVYVCTPKVQELFAVSFDYMSIKNDFIPDLITKEIKLEAVYTHVLETTEGDSYSPFAASCADPRSYFNTCREALERWTYPLVLDTRPPTSTPSQHRYKGRGIYQADSVSPGLRCDIGPIVSIGELTVIGDDTRIRESFIGCNCHIGRNVRIEGSLIFDGVTIEDNVVIENALIFRECTLRAGCQIQGPGCILGRGVVIGKGRVIPPLTRLYVPSKTFLLPSTSTSDMEPSSGNRKDDKKREEADEGKEEEEKMEENKVHEDEDKKTTLVPLVGPDGEGMPWRRSKGGKETMSLQDEEKLKNISVGGSLEGAIKLPLPQVTGKYDDEDETDDDEEDDDFSQRDEDEGSFSSSSQEEDEQDVDMDGEAGESHGGRKAKARQADSCSSGKGYEEKKKKKSTQKKGQDDEAFRSEVQALCEEGLEEPHHIHHKILEMKSFRLACNKTDLDIMKILVPLVLQSICLHCQEKEENACLKKDVWEKYVSEHRVELLFSSFLSSSCQPEDFFFIWEICLSFCMNPFLPLSISKKQKREEEGEDEEDDEELQDGNLEENMLQSDQNQKRKKTNPLHGPSAFCTLCEILHACDLFEADESLPLWLDRKKKAIAEGKNKEEEPFLTSRLTAFCEWLKEDDESEDEEEDEE